MAGVFEIYVKSRFSAAHALAGYAGDCARVHGHNWDVEVSVRCRELDGTGMGMDFSDIRAAVDRVAGSLDHRMLNELEPFQRDNPTSENVARHLFRELSAAINAQGIRVSRVKVSETPDAGAAYWEE